MRTITIGVDLAKQVFSVCSAVVAGRVQERRDLRREAFNHWLPSVLAGTIVAMQACSGAHQQTCATALGDAGTRRALRRRGVVETSDGAAAGNLARTSSNELSSPSARAR